MPRALHTGGTGLPGDKIEAVDYGLAVGGVAPSRADTNLKTPDALYATTALIAGCTLVVINNTDSHRV